jgi:cytochrome c553
MPVLELDADTVFACARIGAIRGAVAALGMTLSAQASAQDASRGAQLYLQLPSAASCVSCHGPDPSQGRNNLLIAAGQPQNLQQALNTVGAMGYLKPLLADADVRDIAAYLGAVQRAAGADSPVALWPVTIEFGGVAVGSVSPVQTVVLRNLRTTALPLAAARIEGPAAGAVLVETDCAAALAPAAECRLRLRAQPLAAGPAAGALVLTTGTAPPWVVPLSYTARTDALGVLSTDLSQASLSFGATAVGEAVRRSFRLVNHGAAPATLGVMTLTGPGRTAFGFEGASGPADAVCASGQTLAPGATCTMRLAFASGLAGDYRAMLQWRGDATQPADVELSAVAAAPSAPPAATPSPPGPPATDAPSGGGGGCAAGPAVRRVDPVMPLLVLGVLAGLWARRRGTGCGQTLVTGLSPARHGVFTGPAYRS